MKVCGITRLEDALAAVELGAAALGFVCWKGSPRCLDREALRAIVQALPPFVLTVGVFVDQPVDEMIATARFAGLHVVQLHGAEDPGTYAGMDVPVIKSISVTDKGFSIDPDAYPPTVTILLDAHDPVRKGGTGQTIDWSMAALLAARRRVILAGGLSASNVGEAIARVRPYAVDVSSGVERAPGIKDPEKLERFVFAVNEATRSLSR